MDILSNYEKSMLSRKGLAISWYSCSSYLLEDSNQKHSQLFKAILKSVLDV